MNTNRLKRFAQDARQKLLQQVAAKLDYVLSADTAELREKAAQLKSLKEELSKSTKGQLVEKVAYTWFNRFIALRFMDVNGYQPLDLRVVSPKDGYTSPELLDEAKRGNIPAELGVDTQHVYGLLDGRVPGTSPQNEAYKELLIAACNHLHSVLPFLFERINDYTELLLPDDLISEFSLVHDVREGMEEEDCQQVEIIGWLYQFYISEKKDEVFASKAKVKKEDIPAATQLFTPRWIVEYMVQNTVGKVWLQNRPNSRLREHMPYFIESASLKSEDYLKINSPEEITLLDQACGSGHILVYGFELLSKIYEEEGYNASEIPKLIIERNLYGFEIDERAAQLAAMALMMKARSYQRRFFRKGEVPQPHILQFRDLKLDEQQTAAALERIGTKPSDELLHDLKNMRQATNLGSLIVLHAGLPEMNNVLRIVKEQLKQADIFAQYDLLQLKTTLEQLALLGQKYHCIVDNPPYMGSGNMNAPLADFVKRNYPDSKADLMACFMESGLAMLQPNGFLGMINQHSWMFLSSYEGLRKKLIKKTFFDTLLHLGSRTFPEIGGEVVQNASFTCCNSSSDIEGKYLRLVDFDRSFLKQRKTLEAIENNSLSLFYTCHPKNFERIPGSPIAYWVGERTLETVGKLGTLKEIGEPRMGLATGNNFKYVRSWHECSATDIGLNVKSRASAKESLLRWFPYSKGGKFRKWYGNNEYVVNWWNDGVELKNTLHPSGTRIWAHNFNLDNIFKSSITWSDITSGNLSVRHNNPGFLFDGSGTSAFFTNEDEKFAVLGLLNTQFSKNFSKVLNPTFHFQTGDFRNMPLNKNIVDRAFIELVKNAIEVTKKDWDAREVSWDFNANELIRMQANSIIDIEEAYDLYQQYWKNKFFQLHRNEVELNKRFIKIYALQDELNPDVPLKEITILQEETSIKNNELIFHADEVMAQFVSYAVGCMFGRYSLDKQGLILANQGETLQDYLRKLEKSEQELSFLPDADNILPILDDEWFEDDIVGRFHQFLKVTFGETNFAKNLAFVEECLGKDIRKYFAKDFYNDHIKRYKKRPIYWLFSSSQGSFNVLIYMHRYTPDTVNNILNKYLREYQEKLRAHREHLNQVEISGSASEKSKAIKEKERIDKVLLELQEYEREILYPLATDRIAIDLDDGVLVNYNRFGKAVKEVKGLNDTKTRKKVEGFDWVKGPSLVDQG
jgi:type II restriction/modification system DNA methylase subunit YeeA